MSMTNLTSRKLNRVLESVVKSLLEEGEIPTPGEVLRELPDLIGDEIDGPLTIYSPVKKGETLQAESYNSIWNRIKSDLVLLYEEIFDQTKLLINGLLFVGSKSKYLESRTLMMEKTIKQVSENSSAPSRFFENFSNLDNIDFDSTTALIDMEERIATLPIQYGSTKKLDLRKATISYKMTKGDSISEIAGSKITNLLDDSEDTMWIAEILGPGRGAQAEITLSLPQLEEIDTLRITPTHKCTVALFGDNTLIGSGALDRTTSFDLKGTIRNIRIVVDRVEGRPFQDKMKYFLGLKNISLLRQSYAKKATLLSKNYPLPARLSNNALEQATQARIIPDAIIPMSTRINYYLLPDGSNDSLVQPNQWYTLIGYTDVCADLTNFTAQTAENGVVPYLSDDAMIRSAKTSFFREGNGVFIANMWRVRSYAYTWDWDTSHIPGPNDWEVLPPGVHKNNIREVFVDISPVDDNTIICSDTARLASGVNYHWELWFYGNKAEVITADPAGGSDHLGSLNSANLIARAHLNKREVPIVATNAQYDIKARWNHLEIFIWTKTSTLPAEVDLGHQFYPLEPTQVIDPATGDAVLPQLKEILYPTGDVSSSWSSTGASHYTEVDEDKNSPDTADYVYTSSLNINDIFSMGNPTGNIYQVGHLEIFLYCRSTQSSPQIKVGWCASSINQSQTSESFTRLPGEWLTVTPGSGWGWVGVGSYNLGSISTLVINNLNITIRNKTAAAGQTNVAAVYAKISYTPSMTTTPQNIGNPNISWARAKREPLSLVSEFDLLYNTPILYKYRASLIEEAANA